MLEMGLSGLMSGDGKRGGAQPSATASILDSTRSDGQLSGVVRVCGLSSSTATHRSLQCDAASHGGVDGATDDGSVSRGYSATLPAAGPGQDLRGGLSPTHPRPEPGGSPLRDGQPLAAGLCGEADRISPA